MTDNPPIRTYVNKIENKITFKIKIGYFLKLLTNKLLGSIKNKITKENGKNVSHLKITEVVLIHCNIVKSDYQHDRRTLYTFVSSK